MVAAMLLYATASSRLISLKAMLTLYMENWSEDT